VETGTMARLLRHRQTKEAETDRPGLTSTAPHSYSTVKPLRAGMPGDSGVLVVTRVRSTNTKCTRGRGCSGHPAFPTPSSGRKIKHDSGASRREARTCVWKRVFGIDRHGERGTARRFRSRGGGFAKDRKPELLNKLNHSSVDDHTAPGQ
jgi:hypothetical protein